MTLKFLIFCSYLASVATYAAEDTQPADFNYEESKKRLANLIQFPEVKGNADAMIHCFSQISTGGKMKDTGCYSRDNFESAFAAAIQKAARKAHLTPARINGKNRKVYVQFRVEFIAKDDRRDIYVHSNPGNEENIAAYGYDHIAAQRAIGDEAWQGVCPQRARFLVTARTYVGEDGQPGTPSLEHINGIQPTIDCQNAIKASMQQSAYVPAMDVHVAVPSAYMESFGN